MHAVMYACQGSNTALVEVSQTVEGCIHHTGWLRSLPAKSMGVKVMHGRDPTILRVGELKENHLSRPLDPLSLAAAVVAHAVAVPCELEGREVSPRSNLMIAVTRGFAHRCVGGLLD